MALVSRLRVRVMMAMSVLLQPLRVTQRCHPWMQRILSGRHSVIAHGRVVVVRLLGRACARRRVMAVLLVTTLSTIVIAMYSLALL